jgi:uncharacterized protein YjbI with pentapeptide repeats
MSYADLRDASLDELRVTYLDLSHADLRGVELTGIDELGDVFAEGARVDPSSGFRVLDARIVPVE